MGARYATRGVNVSLILFSAIAFCRRLMGSVNNLLFDLYLCRYMGVRRFELLIRVVRLFIGNRVRDISFHVCI